MGVMSKGRMARKVPVRTEPHPTFPCYVADGVIFHKIGRPIDKKEFMGERLKGRMTRKASPANCSP